MSAFVALGQPFALPSAKLRPSTFQLSIAGQMKYVWMWSTSERVKAEIRRNLDHIRSGLRSSHSKSNITRMIDQLIMCQILSVSELTPFYVFLIRCAAAREGLHQLTPAVSSSTDKSRGRIGNCRMRILKGDSASSTPDAIAAGLGNTPGLQRLRMRGSTPLHAARILICSTEPDDMQAILRCRVQTVSHHWRNRGPCLVASFIFVTAAGSF